MSARLDAGSGDEITEIADINVTPFIDVALVLLIIFMVAAPLSTVDVPVNLPVSNAAPAERPPDPIFLTLDRGLGLTLGETATPRDALAASLDRATGGDRDRRVALRADAAVSYGDVMGVMNLLRAAGYLHVMLVGLEDGHAGSAPGPVPDP